MLNATFRCTHCTWRGDNPLRHSPTNTPMCRRCESKAVPTMVPVLRKLSQLSRRIHATRHAAGLPCLCPLVLQRLTEPVWIR